MCEKKTPNSECQSEIETKLGYLGTEIADLFQRYGHALDRIISLENRMRDAEAVTILHTPMGGAELPPIDTSHLIDIKNPQSLSERAKKDES